MNKVLLSFLFTFSLTSAALEHIGRPPSLLKTLSKIQVQDYNPVLKDSDFKLIDSLFLKKDLLDKAFPISDTFRNRAKFWLYVYGSIPSSSVMVHNKSDLTIVYKELDFSKLWKSKHSTLDISIIQSDIAQEYVTNLKKKIMNLCMSKNIKEEAMKIHPSLSTTSAKSCSEYQEIANELRLQTGKNDTSQISLKRYYQIKPFLDDLHSLFEIPEEVNSIAFLESSFNPKAHSHAGAYGVWQFMQSTANSFFPTIDSNIDFRANPYIATLGAFHLLKQNYSILDSWELAIPAYNFGVNQILKAKRALNKNNLTLDYLFAHYKDPNLGFASKNYYGNFLAASVLLTHFDKFDMPSYKKQQNKIEFYLSKCPIVPNHFYKHFEDQIHIKNLNMHILKPEHRFPKGLLIVSDQQLTARKYYKISPNELRRNFPKNFFKLIKTTSCH